MNPVIFDIDFDFFFNSEKTILEDPFKAYWQRPEEFFEKHCGGVAPTAICCHSEVLSHWDRAGIQNACCYHFDAHHDIWDFAYNLENLPVGSRLDYVTPGNYLFFALREGIVDKAFLILPDWQDIDYWAIQLQTATRGYAARIQLLRYQDFCLKHTLPKVLMSHLYCALSPEFTPSDCFVDFDKCCGPNPEVMEQGLLIQRDFVAARPRPSTFKYFYDGTTEVASSRTSLYHGSSAMGLAVLRPEDTSRKLFVSPSPAFASCFGLPLCNDLGWAHGVEFLACEKPFVYLLVPKNEDHLLGRPISVYRIDGYAPLFKPDGEISGYEYSCGFEIPVTNEMPFPTAASALDTFGVKVFADGCRAITDSAILGLIRRHNEEIERHFEMPVTKILSLPFYADHLYIYFVGRRLADISAFSRHYSPIWLNLLHRRIMPLAFAYAANPASSYHGLDHAWQVARLALVWALDNGENPLPVLLAAAFHDIARTNDEEDEQHAYASASTARLIMDTHFLDSLSLEDRERVEQTIRNHSFGCKGENSLQSVIWDADRIRLAWERGFRECYFSTDIGKQCVLKGEIFTGNHQAHAFREKIRELKIEITSGCNLSCSFCHQSFGGKKTRQDLNLDICERYLDHCVSSGISMVRFTGGEPFIRKDVHAFFGAAKKRGLYVTVNTNGLGLSPDTIEECVGQVDCFKLSFPAASGEQMAVVTANRKAWEKKLEALALLMAYGFRVEILTIMTPANVREFDTFVELIEPLERVRWLPLRPEPNEFNLRPISRSEMKLLAGKIAAKKMETERWSDLTLNLSVPFCVLDDPAAAPYVFTGRRECGPIQSLTVSFDGLLMNCYSNRQPLPYREDLHSSALESPEYSLSSLPAVCQQCLYAFSCLGGCRCPMVLEDTPYGKLDYLAQPWVIERRGK